MDKLDEEETAEEAARKKRLYMHIAIGAVSFTLAVLIFLAWYYTRRRNRIEGVIAADTMLSNEGVHNTTI